VELDYAQTSRNTLGFSNLPSPRISSRSEQRNGMLFLHRSGGLLLSPGK
jgi:hypothetical protein